MKAENYSSRVGRRYSLIEPLESRIAPAGVAGIADVLPANPTFITAVAGGAVLVKAGQVLTTGSGGGGAYLLYVQQGEVLVHTTDLNSNDQVDFNEVTGLSVGANSRMTLFTDIHGDIVTDLKPDGTLTDGGKGDIVLDYNIASITLRSLDNSDFVTNALQTQPQLVAAHLAMSSYSIFGNIYAGGGVGSATDPTSGIHIETAGSALQSVKFPGGIGSNFYAATTPVIGSIYAGSSASGKAFTFGSSGHGISNTPGVLPGDIHGNLLAFVPAPGEAGASIYNIDSGAAESFSIGTIHAGNGGFNAPGGNIGNVALKGDPAGVYKLIAGNAGQGTTGQAGGSILNYSEAGAFISQAVLQAGNGGDGLTGTGGNGGIITVVAGTSVHLNANVQWKLGNGGNGYSGGGTGQGTAAGQFVTPESKITVPTTAVTTWHQPGQIGRVTPVDFNGDGYSDAVFATSSPSQVVVALNTGDPFFPGFSESNYIFLNSPLDVQSITIGDFNGDGHPDIAVAGSANGFAGVETFLSQYDPKTHAFLGFSDPMFSPLPSLANNGFYYTPNAITKLVSGDFLGDGTTQLAVVVQETKINFGLLPELMYLKPETDASHPLGTGFFYADTSGNNVPYIAIKGIEPADSGVTVDPALSTFIATALQAYQPGTGGHDVVIASAFGGKNFSIVDYSSGAFPTITASYGYGKIDTDRTIGPQHVSLQQFTDQTFTVIQDPTNPQLADVVALSVKPLGFLVTFQGDGTGNFALKSGAGDQSGIDLVNEKSGYIQLLPVQSVSGPYSDLGLYNPTSPAHNEVDIWSLSTDLSTATLINSYATGFVGVNPAVNAIDVFTPHPLTTTQVGQSGLANYGFFVGNPATAYPNFQGFTVLFHNQFQSSTSSKVAGYVFQGGNGGDSLSGAGGIGGSFGQTLTVTGTGASTVGVGSLSVVFPADVNYEGTVIFNGGHGGNGLTHGGNGGTLSGISVTYANAGTLTGSAFLFAGSGGESLTGAGGNGGSLSQLFIVSGVQYVGGNGGIGVVGGSGGSVFGNSVPGQLTSESNNQNDFVIATGGDGATGLTGGGSGGSVLNFADWFLPVLGGEFGYLQFSGGKGGDAVAGQGGGGGSVINSSPYALDNNLAGPGSQILLSGGNGGSGHTAGGGGSVNQFTQQATIASNPDIVRIIGGKGGTASFGAGGTGGSISQIIVAATGIDENSNTPIFNRMVAGSGGVSYGGTGGLGGSITSVNFASTGKDSQIVAAAGAGGAGLLAGGTGGALTNDIVTAGSQSQTGKVLVVAGDGGASFSVAPVNSTPAAIALGIGSKNGAGGTGGSIVNFSEPGNETAHVDLIAGNGGDTPNHSVGAGNATVDNSGKGGSIINAIIQGSIGNSDPTVAIKSYNDILNGQTMQQFVDSYILSANSTDLGDSIGNVGLVAGAAGSVEGVLVDTQTGNRIAVPGTAAPSFNGINGSVATIRAQNIMSMIAGNVDRVDYIQSLTDYMVTQVGGTLGAAKNVFYNPVTHQDQFALDGITFHGIGSPSVIYDSANGALSDTPVPGGGALIDGAFLAKNIRKPVSSRDFVGTQ